MSRDDEIAAALRPTFAREAAFLAMQIEEAAAAGRPQRRSRARPAPRRHGRDRARFDIAQLRALVSEACASARDRMG